MKSLITLFCFLLVCACSIYAQTPTYAGLPDSSHVLVVFNTLDQTSIDVKDYYQTARGIPGSNVLGLSRLVDTLVSDGTTEHWIKLEQQGEIIEDTIHRSDYLESRHAWIYFNERIAIL
jgi:hypothetical protein